MNAPAEQDVLTYVEGKAGRLQADLTEGSTVVETLKPAGLIQPYKPAGWDALPAQYKDPEGYWTAVVLYFLVPAINTEMVKPGDEPKTLDELFDMALVLSALMGALLVGAIVVGLVATR